MARPVRKFQYRTKGRRLQFPGGRESSERGKCDKNARSGSEIISGLDKLPWGTLAGFSRDFVQAMQVRLPTLKVDRCPIAKDSIPDLARCEA